MYALINQSVDRNLSTSSELPETDIIFCIIKINLRAKTRSSGAYIGSRKGPRDICAQQ